jgi:ABC-type multidrug transport system ATPase subunit
LKRDKVVVLTTHAMEEADVLSDRIAVICDGKLKCIGTPLYLKNTFGDGYRINLVCKPGFQTQVINLMNEIAPSSKLIDESGGSMVFTVPITSISDIGPLFSLIQVEEEPANQSNPKAKAIQELKSMTNDSGISHTTLEEVFMKVTGKKIQKYVPK